jgi:hypothetical protein
MMSHSLPILNNSSSIHANNHLAIDSNNMATSNNNSSSIVDKTIINKAPVINKDPIKIDYRSPRINTQ